MPDTLPDPAQPKRSPAQLLLGLLLLLLLVYFVFPVLFMAYYERFAGTSPRADAVVGMLCKPIDWLYANCPAYEWYLDWLARVLLNV